MNGSFPTSRIARALVAARWPLLIVGLVICTIAWFPSQQLDFDRSLEKMFAPDDPLIQRYMKSKALFGGYEIVLAVYTDPNLLAADHSGIERLAEVTRQLSEVPGVVEVLSLSKLDAALAKMGALAGSPTIVDTDNAVSVKFREIFQGYTHSEDGNTVGAMCMLQSESELPIPRREQIERLRAVMDDLPDGTVTGEPVMISDGFRYVEQDGERLGWTSTILLALVILYCFRSLRWVIIPLIVVQATLLMTHAILVWTDINLSMVSSMLTAIVTVIGVATIMHVIVRFREGRALGLAPRDALTRALTILAVPIFWSCVTDAVGFASLLVSEVGPVRDFGAMMAVGALMVLVSVVLFVPALALFGQIGGGPKRMWGEGTLDRQLHWLVGWVERRSWLVGGLAISTFAAAAIGATWLQVESDFTKNFRADSPIVQAYNLVEDRLGGAGVWEIVLPAPETLTVEYLGRVDRLQKRLRTEVTRETDEGAEVPALHVLSLADAVDAGLRGLGPMSRFLPATARIRLVSAGMQTQLPYFMQALHAPNPDGEAAYRILLRAVERQPAAQKKAIIRQVRQIVDEEFPEAQPTGLFVLLTYLIDSILRDQWLAFGAAIAGIGLCMTIAFRNPIDAGIALLPNALPILVVTGLMGWLDLKINMGAAMIAAVSLGLSIDSSIHYIIEYRRARRAGKGVQEALNEVQATVGRAAVFATLALIVGFAWMCTSQFIPTVYFGVLVSLTMLGGLLGNLIVLPLCLIIRQRIVTRFRPIP